MVRKRLKTRTNRRFIKNTHFYFSWLKSITLGRYINKEVYTLSSQKHPFIFYVRFHFFDLILPKRANALSERASLRGCILLAADRNNAPNIVRAYQRPKIVGMWEGRDR